jgi:hypothetical protein
MATNVFLKSTKRRVVHTPTEQHGNPVGSVTLKKLLYDFCLITSGVASIYGGRCIISSLLGCGCGKGDRGDQGGWSAAGFEAHDVLVRSWSGVMEFLLDDSFCWSFIPFRLITLPRFSSTWAQLAGSRFQLNIQFCCVSQQSDTAVMSVFLCSTTVAIFSVSPRNIILLELDTSMFVQVAWISRASHGRAI